MRTTNNLLLTLRQKNQELYSPQVQIKIEQLSNQTERQEFLKERTKFRNYLHALERQNLESILARMSNLEEEFNQAIMDLDRELENIHNTVSFLGTLRNISSLLARVVTIF